MLLLQAVAYASIRHWRYAADSSRHSSVWAFIMCSFRQAMYSSFALEHSRKWSRGKLPLSGGFGGSPFAGTEAKLAMRQAGAYTLWDAWCKKGRNAVAVETRRELRDVLT